MISHRQTLEEGDLITKLTRFILSLVGIMPLLFSDKGFLDTQYHWYAKMARMSAERQRCPLEVPLLSLQAISIKIVVSPIKDKCPKEILTTASMCIYLITLSVQDPQ
jgi:hypothetical protein